LSGTSEEVVAKKTYVISMLTNEALEDPEAYGLGKDGGVKVGDKIDFSKMATFGDRNEFDQLLEDANKLPEPKIKNFLANNAKIEAWVNDPANADVPIISGSGQVTEILDTKVGKVDKPETGILAREYFGEKVVEARELSNLVAIPETDISDPDSLRKEIEEHKARLLELEKNAPQNTLQNAPQSTPLRTMAGDSVPALEVERSFQAAIDGIYAKKSLFGGIKTHGIATKEWGEVAGLPANKVLDYYNHPENSDLPKNVIASLQVSAEHRNLVEGINGLKQEVETLTKASGSMGVEIKPFDRESMEAYIRRLGGFRLKLAK
ncbi:MAG: hypothetical protein AAB392_00245, partial [Patescibacteria group bacterium]